jgi:hypothetical protein
MKKIVAFMMACIIPLHANAAFECNVKVINILIYSEGTVNIVHAGRNDYTHICNLNAERAGVSPTTCAMWAGMLQAIKKKDGLATFYYGGTGTCATLPTYASAPVPSYIGDVTP